jgi:hypothetical protein
MATKLNVATRDGVLFRTADATPVVAATFTAKPLKIYWYEIKVAASYEDGSKGGTWWRQAAFRSDSAGAVTQIGSTRSVVTDNEDTGGMDLTVAASTTTVAATVTGVAATNIQWLVSSDVKEVDYINLT